MTVQPRILVTGGAGFIGSHLARRLVSSGVQLVILDDLSSGSRENLHQKAVFHHGSVVDADLVRKAARGCTGIVHLAATVSVPECVADWIGGHRVNIGGTINVFEAAHDEGDIPVVYASSAAVYGDQSGAVCHEGLLPAPLSPYGADKLACEHHARAFWTIHRQPSAGLRFFNVFGPGQSIRSPYAGVVARFCANAESGQAHTIYGDGLQTRDFVHVVDVVEIISRALSRLAVMPDAIVSNVCTNRTTSLLDLIEILDCIFPGSASNARFLNARAGDIRLSRGDDRLMRKLFGSIQAISLRQGLTDIVRRPIISE